MAASPAIKAFADDMLTEAEKLAGEADDLKERRRANREILRNLATQGSLDTEQAKKVDDIYPRPKRDGDATDTTDKAGDGAGDKAGEKAGEKPAAPKAGNAKAGA